MFVDGVLRFRVRRPPRRTKQLDDPRCDLEGAYTASLPFVDIVFSSGCFQC